MFVMKINHQDRQPSGRHHSHDRMHLWQGQGGQSGVMVWGQQPHPQHGQDEGDDSGHEEEEETSLATVHPGAWSREDEQHYT